MHEVHERVEGIAINTNVYKGIAIKHKRVQRNRHYHVVHDFVRNAHMLVLFLQYGRFTLSPRLSYL